MRNLQAGFTLIELVIVIILLGIIGATVTPKFINIQNNARQAVVEAAAGAVQSTALIGFAANNGGPNNLSVIIGSTDGVGDPAGAADSAGVQSTTAPCTAGGGDAVIVLEHVDDATITATATIPDDFCDAP